jgi:hypothetical protein
MNGRSRFWWRVTIAGLALAGLAFVGLVLMRLL